MKNALVYSCVLLLLSCGGKTGGTSQSSSTNQETQENALSEKTTAISEAFSMDFYKGSDWIIPETSRWRGTLFLQGLIDERCL